MNKILPGIICFFGYIFSIQAQTLYGTTFGGGNGGGTINKFIPAYSDLIVAKSFENLPYFDPFFTSFIQANDGKLYGMTASGGSSNLGIIFSFDASSSTYTKLVDFDSANGRGPLGSLIQASDGKLYGMTYGGGSSDAGVIFSFDASSSTFTKLMDFDNTNGRGPEGSLIQATDGKLYGMTNAGGSSDKGVIFSFDLSTSTYTKLRDFDVINGASPSGSLIQASDGKLYGMTTYGLPGGNSEYGVIFSFDPSTSTFTKLKDFDETIGGNPYGSLIEVGDGTLYGLASSGGSNTAGVIFSFVPSTSSYTKLLDFDNTNGAYPYGSFTQASDGKLYAMASGGINYHGVIFSFDPSSLAYTKLRDFTNDDGGGSNGSLIQASDGKLYGMTNRETEGLGVIFSFNPSLSVYTKLKDFATNESGTYACGSLVRASDGKLYGMTNRGGSNGYGVIYTFNPSGFNYTKLVDFDYTNGGIPYGGLMQASDGKLYGMTEQGGSNGVGVIFSFDPSSSTYTKLRDFDDANGFGPSGNLMQATNGKLYGMTDAGGNNLAGVLFSFDPLSTTYIKLKDFDVTNGGSPQGNGLIQASNGKLYGMTVSGGSNDAGVIFSLDPSSSTYTKIMDFEVTNGGYPSGSLIQASDGKFYGVTINGGSNTYGGVIFSFDPLSFTYTKLKDFDETAGGYPSGSLIQASDGKLYGMLSQGGSSNNGVIFSFDPSTATYAKLKDYSGDDGANPNFGSGFVEVNDPLPVTLISFSGKNNGNGNQLSWKVENEQNLNYYEIQRSIDGQYFKGIGQIQAAGNNSYAFNDPLLNSGYSLYYYRLKSMDKDGKFMYSGVVKIRTDFKRFTVVNPNPFKNGLVVNIESLIQDKATFIVTDLNGRRLFKENTLLFAGKNTVGINGSSKLSKGTYLLVIITSQQTESFKVIKGY